MCAHLVDEDSKAQQMSDPPPGTRGGPECGRKVALLLVSQLLAWESWSCPVSQPQTGNLRNWRISLG